MCGIAGIFNYNSERVEMDVLKTFTDSMLHRGPDGSGYELLNKGTIGLGHRRLSILDLSEAGEQPFYYLDRYCIVYNGEIFNFESIRQELKDKGYHFRSQTDTEVLIAAYDCYGMDCFHLFNGMWAFALWDMKENKLILSRDRFGVKPLYYSCISQQQFVFASETRSFKYLKGFERKVNQAYYELSLKNNYALEGLGYTLFEGIYQLMPGHYMEIREGEVPVQKRWYDIRERVHKIPVSKDEQFRQFYEIFRDACRIRLISDVPVATALSGGLDSTSIYSTVNDILKTGQYERISKESQVAVSAIFPGLENDEKEYVDKAINFTQGKIKWVITDTRHLTADIEKDTELYDSISNAPVSAISAIYKGMKKEGITVSLDGHGADEMLYGYLYMVYDLWSMAIEKMDRGKAKVYSEILAGLYHPEHQKKQVETFEKMNRELLSPLRRLKSGLKQMMLMNQKDQRQYLPPELPSLSDKPYDFSGKPAEERMLYFEFFQNSLPALLRNFDRAGMMNSVEIRMPFLDYRVVEFIFSLPMESKIGGGFTKRILREVMKGRMDETIRKRTYKVGIGSPFQYWADHYIKDWLYQKVGELEENEGVHYRTLLDKYYSENRMADLEAVWCRINLKLIN
jgi:asparagine synthase (glutamine-hydrolysing)